MSGEGSQLLGVPSCIPTARGNLEGESGTQLSHKHFWTLKTLWVKPGVDAPCPPRVGIRMGAAKGRCQGSTTAVMDTPREGLSEGAPGSKCLWMRLRRE